MSDCISLSDQPVDPTLARRLIELTQAGLPLVDDPWAWLAARLNMTPEEALLLLKQLQANGLIRRIAAVPNHYRLGYRHNGMTVWDVDDARIDELGHSIGSLPYVSHCYQRPRREGWPYNLFAMVHGLDATDIEHYRYSISAMLGDACRAHEMLVSTRILKKTGLRLPPPASC
ncbi:MAG: nitrite reductase [Betaproteobacteria bacterium]|nr:nitrite reductase [Betaproteobacteria bacterium]